MRHDVFISFAARSRSPWQPQSIVEVSDEARVGGGVAGEDLLHFLREADGHVLGSCPRKGAVEFKLEARLLAGRDLDQREDARGADQVEQVDLLGGDGV